MAHLRTSHSSDSPATLTGTSNEKPIPTQNEFMHDEKSLAHHPVMDEAAIVFSNVDEKKVLRKMDIRLLPMLALLYLLSFLDRGNIGNAKIEGLTETLNISGPEYNWCLTVFFFTYCAFEVPSNLM